MSLNNIFDIAGSAMSAETVRMSTSASNMANANVVVGSPDEVYQAQYPVFTAIQAEANAAMAANGQQPFGGVSVTGIYQSDADPFKRFEPNNPVADQDGFVYAPAVNHVEEMANMISASRSYQINLELIGTTKQLMQRTLQLGQ